MTGDAVLAVGCAQWTHHAWRARDPGRGGSDLARYARWCTAVEGNTTFYALPTPDTVARWRADTPDDFRFCFKVPREVSHDRRLRDAAQPLRVFLDRIGPLGDRLGPVWVQLPASFGPADLPVLDRFLAGRPDDRRWAVEVRHRSFEAQGPAERALHDLLHARDVDRVVIDTRALFGVPPVTPAEHEAWERKPRMRVRPVALGPHPTVRFIGCSDPDATAAHWQPWLDPLIRWIEEGRRPMVFVHTPDNADAPLLCRRLHDEVRARLPRLAPLPQLPDPPTASALF